MRRITRAFQIHRHVRWRAEGDRGADEGAAQLVHADAQNGDPDTILVVFVTPSAATVSVTPSGSSLEVTGNPTTTLSVEAQERRERREKQFGDRDDWYR